MIETAMLVALGFFAATVLALLVMPLISHRAARLAAQRLETLVPLSVEEIAAERDGIRAVSAVEQRRLEQKLELAAAATATAELELGRRTTELVGVERAREAEAAGRAALFDDLVRVREVLTSVEARRDELEREVADLKAGLAREEQERRAITSKRDEFEALSEERRGTVASLETRVAGLEARLGDRQDEIERNRVHYARLRATFNETARDRDLARNELLLVSTQRSMLQDDIRTLTRRGDDARARLQAKSEALATTERRLMEETVERKTAEAGLADLRRRFHLLEARLIAAGGQAAQTLVETELDALRVSVSDVADTALVTLAEWPQHSVEATGQETETTAAR